MTNLFAYGTLMCEEIIRSVAGCLPDHAPALLHGYGRYGISGELYPGIREEPSSRVQGIVYFALEDDAWKRLDAFEGEQYRRLDVTLHTDTGTLPAATYVFKPEFHHLLTSEPWDFEMFMARRHLFITGYQGFSSI